MHAAITQLPRVDRRVLALLWQLAERWGRVTPSGVEVRLELTHETLGGSSAPSARRSRSRCATSPTRAP
jgi:hypothetical protein